MVVLALDSTTPTGSVALQMHDGHTLERRHDPEATWSQRLPGSLLALLAQQGLTVTDVDVFAVCTGPGSLTGLRVGIATLQGLAVATGRPVVPVSVFEAVAQDVWASPEGGWSGGAATASNVVAEHADRPACHLGIWLNALRGEVFTAAYVLHDSASESNPWRATHEPAVSTPADAVAAWAEAFGNQPLVVEGDISDAAFVAPLLSRFPLARLRQRPTLATAVSRVAARRAALGLVASPHAIQPFYLRPPDVVLARGRQSPPMPDQRTPS